VLRGLPFRCSGSFRGYRIDGIDGFDDFDDFGDSEANRRLAQLRGRSGLLDKL
jgi:hypothetical protein